MVDVDDPPSLTASATSPACVASPLVTLRASVTAPGSGPMSYVWDLGDGSPTVLVTGPATPVTHAYPALPAIYTARLTASDARVPGCRSASTRRSK